MVIPNGAVRRPVRRRASRGPEWRGDGGTVAFVGRLDEPRKGFPLLAAAFAEVAATRPGLRLLVVGGGDVDEARELLPAGRARPGRRSSAGARDADKAAALRTADVYVAPNTGGESFGIVLVEAMAAGATVLASDLPAFRRVLDDGAYGVLFPNGDADDLAARLAGAARRPGAAGAPCDEARPARRTPLRLVDGGRRRSVRVYETVRAQVAAMTGLLRLCLALVAALVLLGLWLTWTANRLDRMHHRIDVARATPRHPAAAPRPGPPSSWRRPTRSTRPAGCCCSTPPTAPATPRPEEFEAAESGAVARRCGRCSPDAERRCARQQLDDGRRAAASTSSPSDCARVELARRFHNDVVVSARALRSRRRVRLAAARGARRRAAHGRPRRRAAGGPRGLNRCGRGRAGP